MNGRWLDGLVGNPLALLADVGAAIGACLLPLFLATLLNRLPPLNQRTQGTPP